MVDEFGSQINVPRAAARTAAHPITAHTNLGSGSKQYRKRELEAVAEDLRRPAACQAASTYQTSSEYRILPHAMRRWSPP
jgi:hypothetical protein